MTRPKNAYFRLPLQQLSAKCKTLGSPARLEILDRIADRGLYVNELVAQLPLVQGTVSSHLQKLENADLVHVAEHGLYNEYILNIQALDDTIADLDRYRRYLKRECELVTDERRLDLNAPMARMKYLPGIKE